MRWQHSWQVVIGLAWAVMMPLALAEDAAPWVVTTQVSSIPTLRWHLTGTVQARHEIPLAFRLGGAIQERAVEIGDQVVAGQMLFRLDPRDVIQQQIAAEAMVASARAEMENAQRERERQLDLLRKKLVSQQDYDRANTAARAASEQLIAAQAALKQAVNAIAYATLTAPVAGVIVAVSGQHGQIVSAGQPLAVVAEAGAREIVVAVPEDRRASLPSTATAQPFGSTAMLPVTLRELAATADPLTRTWLARYQVDSGGDEQVLHEPPVAPALALGTTVTLHFAAPSTAPRLRVPLGAILEQGQGAVLWRIADGQVQPEPVTIVGIDGEFAEIQTTLAPGTPVVALGVDRLLPGQTVRVRTP